MSDQDLLTEKIDRYGALLEEQKQLYKEIVDLMHKNNFARHFGKEYEASLCRVEKKEFTDKEKVVALLQELKLLDKVRVPTQSTILALLTDPSVPTDAKTKLANFIRTVLQERLQIDKTESL